MLAELHVRDLGLIEDLTLVFGPGMTALTGETGAGKTLLVEAIELLMGERADPVLVRAGAEEARVEGRFAPDVEGDTASDEVGELVLARVVPRTGRSRAYVDGSMASAAELVARAEGLVDLHGQHAHQSLLRPSEQRSALDRHAGIDTSPLVAGRARLVAIESALEALGGDERSRERELDLLRFELAEIDKAGVDDAGEDLRLEAEEQRLASATTARLAGEEAVEALREDGGVSDTVGRARARLAGHVDFGDIAERLVSLAAELDEVSTDLRHRVESVVEDPQRLDAVAERRRVLADLCRRYAPSTGGATVANLTAVLERRADTAARLAEIEHHAERVAELEGQRRQALTAIEEETARLGRERRAGAPRLAEAIESRLKTLALPRARFEIAFDDEDPGGESATFLLAANAGQPPLPLAKVASGGELSRTMLAARLVLSSAPATLVFDEVDSGVGGEAALAVGRALGELAAHHQVLVVTHLPQVAAFADRQIAVSKMERAGRTVATARTLDDEERVVELSRMLSGQPESATARDHAEELLAVATRTREGR